MSETIYRKYRPQKFDEILGQNHVKITLENEITSGRLAHAYLFAGPRGVGKTTIARLLAKSINCQKRKPDQSEPCNTCEACQEIMTGRSLDLIEMDAASHTGVDNVRENIIENSRFTPTRWPYKIFIIDEAHMLSLAAFNALLKTLEEPPKHIIFILCTTEIHRLPETIISRCQRFDFRKIGQVDLVKRLKTIVDKEKVRVDDDVLARIARQGDGSSRDAESLLGQILTLGEKHITADLVEHVLPRSNLESVITLFEHIVNRNAAAGLELLNTLAEEGVNFTQFLKELVDFLRKILLIKVHGSLDIFASLELTQEMEKSTLNLSNTIELNRLVKAINMFINAERDLKYADIPQLPLELVVVELCESEESNPPPTHTQTPPSYTPPPAAPPSQPTQRPTKKTALKMTLMEIIQRWPEVLTRAQESYHTLVMALKVSQPKEVLDDTLVLASRYPFYAKHLKSQPIRPKIEQLLADVFGEPIRIDTVVVEANEEPEQKPDLINPLLETFGGEVVG